MTTGIRVWEIADGELKPTTEETFAAGYHEDKLESWISKNPDILGTKLLIIDRQRNIPGVGVFDLLGIDQDAKLVIIELKRDRTTREAVAQALDYASWLDSQSEETIIAFAEEFLRATTQEVENTLADAFSGCFGTELPDLDCQNHRILLVAPRLDQSVERVINYLAERWNVPINAVFFQHAKLSDGKEILARSLLVADKPPPPPIKHAQLATNLLARRPSEMSFRWLTYAGRWVHRAGRNNVPAPGEARSGTGRPRLRGRSGWYSA